MYLLPIKSTHIISVVLKYYKLSDYKLLEYYKLSVSGEKQFEGKLSEIFLTLENMGTNAILLSLCFKCFNYRFMICFYSLKTLRLPETMYKSIHV